MVLGIRFTAKRLDEMSQGTTPNKFAAEALAEYLAELEATNQ